MKKTKPHNMAGQICHWFYCIRCGEIALKNDASRKALIKPCPGSDEDK